MSARRSKRRESEKLLHKLHREKLEQHFGKMGVRYANIDLLKLQRAMLQVTGQFGEDWTNLTTATSTIPTSVQVSIPRAGSSDSDSGQDSESSPETAEDEQETATPRVRMVVPAVPATIQVEIDLSDIRRRMKLIQTNIDGKEEGKTWNYFRSSKNPLPTIKGVFPL